MINGIYYGGAVMHYVIVWTNRKTGGQGQSDIYFSNLEHARSVARIAYVENPGNDYTVMPREEGALV